MKNRFNSDTAYKETNELVKTFGDLHEFPFARNEILRELRQRAHFEDDREALDFLREMARQ